jgi:polyisoprenyl-phosphate glycosyltransferase
MRQRTRSETRQQVSIVIPVYNECETLAALFARLATTIERCADVSFEVILVDDGSRDGSADIVDEFCDRDARFKAIHLSRNFGHQAALQAGLDAAGGDAVVLMDGDLQDPPEMVERFIAKWREGKDVVYAIRRSRQDAGWKRATARLFYSTLKVMSADVDIAADVGDFCLMDRRVVEAMAGLRERNRFLRGLRSWVGFDQAGIEYDRDARHAGQPKYTLRKLAGLALSGYLGFSLMPLRIATWLGVASAGVGAAVASWALWTRLAGVVAPQGWATTIALVLFIGGVQLLVLGVMGEYLGRVYEEVRARPVYVVRSRVGLTSAEETPLRERARSGAV